MENGLFNLKFTAKQLDRQAIRTGKEVQAEKKKAVKYMKAGHKDIAAIHCQNAVRKTNEQKNLIRLSSQISSVASRVQTAVTMRTVSNNMTQLVRNMDGLMKTMNVERMATVMEQFSEQNEDMDVLAEQYGKASSTATTVPQDEVNDMMRQLADQAGIEIAGELAAVPESSVEAASPSAINLDARLQRLRAE